MDKLILLALVAVALPLGASYVVKPKTTAQIEAEIAKEEKAKRHREFQEFELWYWKQGRIER